MRIELQRLALAGLFIISSPGWGDQPVAVEIKRLSMDTALVIARAAISECRKQGIQIGAVVVDRGGRTQVALRDTVAADITLRIAEEKAYAALSFNVPTAELAARAKTPLGTLDGLIMLPGGLPIQAGDEIYGAVGVSGAPSGKVDEDCARAGIKAVIDDLEMG
jgi:uncharacterized protein GlcG (DUF336 family)